MSVQYNIWSWNANQSYQKFDVVYGIFDQVNFYSSPYFYGTQASVGQHPSGRFNFNLTSYSRTDDLTTIYFTQTGATPPLQAGAIVKISGVAANNTINFTGMVIDGGSGYATYVNPGWNQGAACGGAIDMLNPAWTTGFLFQPTYSSKVSTENKPIITQLGDLYSQRQPGGINTFTQSWALLFQNRNKREMKAITVFIQDHAGSYPFEILVPDAFLSNQPNQKFVATPVEATPVSYGLYDFQTTVTRVFDP